MGVRSLPGQPVKYKCNKKGASVATYAWYRHSREHPLIKLLNKTSWLTKCNVPQLYDVTRSKFPEKVFRELKRLI